MEKKLNKVVKIIELNDTKKVKKDSKTGLIDKVEIRKVVMQDEAKTLRITITQERDEHELRELDITDLNTDVEIDLKMNLGPRQSSIYDFNDLGKKEGDE